MIMPRKDPLAPDGLPLADNGQHPAVQAWRRLYPGTYLGVDVEVLQPKRKAIVYRLRGPLNGCETIIAKRASTRVVRLEQEVYATVLPHHPISRSRSYGSCQDDDSEYSWIFLEDCGVGSYSGNDPAHRAALSRWIGHLHGHVSENVVAESLPDRGVDRYLDAMDQSRMWIRSSRDNDAIDPDGHDILDRVLARLDNIEDRWMEVSDWCSVSPPCFVHGDLQPKNLIVRSSDDGEQLFIIDWEYCGWGCAGVDLGRIDPKEYWTTIRDYWPLSFDQLETTIRGGRVLQILSAIGWACNSLRLANVERPLASLVKYDRYLAGLLGECE